MQKGLSYDLKLSHNTSVTDGRRADRQTDRRQLVAIARPLLSYGRLKRLENKTTRLYSPDGVTT